MINSPGPVRILLHLRLALVMVRYFFSCVWLGIEMFYHYALLSAEGRKLVQDLRVSVYGELRDQVKEDTVRRVDRLLATMRKGARKWEKASPVTQFIVEPVRRNMAENCEMLEELAAKLKQAADAKASSPEQDSATERESGA